MQSASSSHARSLSGRDTVPGGKGPGISQGLVIGIVLWIIGAVLFSALAVVVHNHPAAWPFELQITHLIQGQHPVPCIYHVQSSSGADRLVDFINSLNDPIQAVVIPIGWMIILFLFRMVLQAIFLGLAVLSSSGVWFAVEKLVARPRATTAQGICVHRNIGAYSFPSGHVFHDTVLYGFLLYLTFTPQARQWRYRWVLIPFQVLFVLYMLAVGYARLESGEHHPLDVLGAYLVAVLWLSLFIFLYRWVNRLWTERRAKKRGEKLISN
jgi:membrane-associated phospholipid phosphatase